MPVAAGVVGDDGVRALLATLDMPAERRRAAALDGRHHLQLVEADVTGIGRTPRRPVVAEDIRDLQLWTGHCGGLRRRVLRAGLSVFFGWTFCWRFLRFLRGCASMSSGLSTLAIMPVATRV